MDRLEELVYLTIGRASICWSEFPKGVFDDETAHRLGQELITAIREYKQEEKQEPAQQQPAPTIVPFIYPYNPLMPPYQWTCNSEKIRVIWSAGTEEKQIL